MNPGPRERRGAWMAAVILVCPGPREGRGVWMAAALVDNCQLHCVIKYEVP